MKQKKHQEHLEKPFETLAIEQEIHLFVGPIQTALPASVCLLLTAFAGWPFLDLLLRIALDSCFLSPHYASI